MGNKINDLMLKHLNTINIDGKYHEVMTMANLLDYNTIAHFSNHVYNQNYTYLFTRYFFKNDKITFTLNIIFLDSILAMDYRNHLTQSQLYEDYSKILTQLLEEL